MNNHQYTSTYPLRCYMRPYSLNFSRVKIFADFAVLSHKVKILTSKYLSKHTFSLRNALSLQKFYLEIKKSGSTTKLFTLEKFRLYGILYTTYRITGYIRSRNFRTDTGKLNFESFIFVYIPYSNNVLYSNN